MDFKELMEKMIESIDEDKGKVIKSIPLKPEWEKKARELKIIVAHMAEMKCKMNSLRASLWSQIELDIGEFKKNMSYNFETDMIDIYDTDK